MDEDYINPKEAERIIEPIGAYGERRRDKPTRRLQTTMTPESKADTIARFIESLRFDDDDSSTASLGPTDRSPQTKTVDEVIFVPEIKELTRKLDVTECQIKETNKSGKGKPSKDRQH